MGNKKKQKSNNKNTNVVIFVLAAVLISFAVYSFIMNAQKQQISDANAGGPPLTESSGEIAVEPKAETPEISGEVPSDVDLKILKSEVTEKATFYPYKADGVYMEVLALKASDGSIRTALNTCQICYNSGQGYYKQEGDKLVCQNCGNRFGVDDVEVVRGGCNPVPVLQENKSDAGEYITINKDFLVANKELFAAWKR